MSGSETVYVAARSRGGECKWYHTDRDCRQLATARRVFEYRLSNLDHMRECCSVCAGDVDLRGFRNRGHYDALVEAGKEYE